MITESKFEYGNKAVPFNESNLFVDYVDSHHDLTEWEDRLTERGETYAVYSVTNQVGHKIINPTLEYKWALISDADIAFNQLDNKEKTNDYR